MSAKAVYYQNISKVSFPHPLFLLLPSNSPRKLSRSRISTISKLRFGTLLDKRNTNLSLASILIFLYSHYRKAVGALLVYDITRKNSFINAQKWLLELKQYAEPDCIILLVGNKVDLIENNSAKREIFTEEARNFADENKLIFFETSALGNVKVIEAFDSLINGIITCNNQKYTLIA